jgi:general secretion pathway protein C
VHIDALIKRYFILIVCLFLAIAAYFQARGIGQLVSIALMPEPVPSPVDRRQRPRPAADPDHTTSARLILERNPFDSVTGSLLGSELDARGPAARVAADPLEDPHCKFARVVMIVASDDAAWSFAAIAAPGQKTALVRTGDALAGHAVGAIGWDRVWLSGGGERCQMVVGDHTAAPALAPSMTQPPSSYAGPSARPGALPPEIASRIRRISDTEFAIDRSAVQAIMERQAELLGRVRVLPERGEGGKVTGVKLGGVRQDSLLDAVGLANGDSLQKINGFDVGDPSAALEAYAKLQNADRLTLSLMRGGKPMNIDLRIQ